MALRVRCKCGKSMQIPTALAGRKLHCPGCNRAFSIPAEKFKPAAPKKPASPATAKKPPAVAKPPPEAPMPAPVELDLHSGRNESASGDLPVLECEEPSGLIADAGPLTASRSGKLGLTCPLCQKTLAPAAAICLDCGFNVTTGSSIKSSLPPGVAAVTSAPTATYASDRPWMAGSGPGWLDSDVIQSPTRSFWGDALTAFVYPVRGAGNGVTFAIIAFIYLMKIPLSFVCCLINLLGTFFIEGWLAAVYLSVLRDTASGSAELPGIKMEEGVLEDILKPFLKYLGAFACAFLPAAAYVILMSLGALPTSLHSGLNLMLLAAAAVFFWPVFLMLFSFNALDMIIRVDLIFTTVYRTLLPYISLWLMLLLVGFIKFLPILPILVARAGLNIPLPALPQFGGLIGEGVFSLVDLYLSLVSMRLIGLYYLHFKKRFTLVME